MRPSHHHQPANAKRHHRGFTLVEMLLVLAVLATLAALAWPSMERVYRDLELKQAAQDVRTSLSQARLHAIDSGLIYQFRYEPMGQQYVVIPWEREFDSSSGDAQSGIGNIGASAAPVIPKSSGRLGEELRFEAARNRDMMFATLADQSAGSETLNAELLAGLPEASRLAQASWSTPILFYPEGSGTDVTFDLLDQRGQFIRISVRGLTGAVTIGPVQQEAGR